MRTATAFSPTALAVCASVARKAKKSQLV